jgi:hypothetical protein
MKESIKLNAKGYVKALAIYPDRTEVLWEGPNALTANAKDIVAKLLGQVQCPLDNITAYNTATPLATAVCTATVSPATVEILGTFTEASFAGVVDELRLQSSSEGDFSIITGLNVTKTNAYQLAIQWTLTINTL